MTQWVRARIDVDCGACGTRISLGGKIQVTLLGRRLLVRCPRCAESQTPRTVKQTEISGFPRTRLPRQPGFPYSRDFALLEPMRDPKKLAANDDP